MGSWRIGVMKEMLEEFRIKMDEKNDTSRQYICKWSYIISEKSIKSLKDFVKEIEKEEYDCHFSVNYDRWYGATKECNSVIREESKKELKSKSY